MRNGLFLIALLLGCPPPANSGGSGGSGGDGTGVVGNAVDQNGKPISLSFATTGAAASLQRVTSTDEDEDWPVVAPDGKYLLVQVTTNRPNGKDPNSKSIVGIDPNASTARQIFTPPNVQAETPSWTQDGKAFVYVSDSTGQWAVVRSLAAAPNAAVSVIVGTNMVARPMMARISPSGQRVVFVTRVHDIDTLATVAVDGSNLTILGPGSAPSWSADSTRVLFTRTVAEKQQIFMMDGTTGGSLVQVTGDQMNHYMPMLSPDGRWIIFSAEKDGTSSIYAVHPEGTGLVQLTKGPGHIGAMCWAIDGWIYFALDASGVGNHDIYRLQPTGLRPDAKTAPPPLPSAMPSASSSAR